MLFSRQYFCTSGMKKFMNQTPKVLIVIQALGFDP
jgi:hypothetical protein